MKNGKTVFEPLLIIMSSVFVFGAVPFAPLLWSVSPACFMILERRHGPHAALRGAALGALLLFAMDGPVSCAVYILTMAVPGTLFGVLAGRASGGAAFLLPAIALSVAAKVLQLLLNLYPAGAVTLLNITPETAGRLAAEFAGMMSQSSLNISYETARLYVMQSIEIVSQRAPMLLITFSACDTMASYLLSRWIIKKYGGGRLVSITPFGLWRLPRDIFWAFLAAAAMDLVGGLHPPGNFFTIVSVNILELLRLLLILEGLALCWYYMTARRVNRFFKVTAAGLCLFLSPLRLILSGVGFVDICFDLRRHIRRR